jgi:hypothetical protein
MDMQVLRREDQPDGPVTLAPVGYGSESGQTVLELTLRIRMVTG